MMVLGSLKAAGGGEEVIHIYFNSPELNSLNSLKRDIPHTCAGAALERLKRDERLRHKHIDAH